MTELILNIISDCIKHWRALRQWRHLNYLIKIAGSRTVPVEIGSRYTDDDWTQKLLNFSEFLQKYVLSKRNRVGYLAQHQLFDQVRFFKPFTFVIEPRTFLLKVPILIN